ncbi:uncharacterized protein LOC111903362 [Lactuca sativa]|uniref:uncharacterized protein LOC111903362 n=1 Tax=Lactuca sativa TaxID=4236 RepID=UPI000CD9D278|nr:uncharacterized protein LOC111903362 [Lactuca sativa]
MFGLDDVGVNEIDQPVHLDEFMMIFDKEESSGSQHSTSKPKKKKNKKLAVTRKEFVSLQSKVNQILTTVSSNKTQNTELPTPQSLVERVEILETREHLTSERISLKIEMGIRALDNNRTADQKQFVSTAENLIKEVTTLKEEIKSTLESQTAHSKHLVQETHNAYESVIVVLQSTINNLRRSVSDPSHVNEILNLTKEIHQLFFNKEIPNNLQVSELIKQQFTDTFSKKQCPLNQRPVPSHHHTPPRTSPTADQNKPPTPQSSPQSSPKTSTPMQSHQSPPMQQPIPSHHQIPLRTLPTTDQNKPPIPHSSPQSSPKTSNPVQSHQSPSPQQLSPQQEVQHQSPPHQETSP